jgi:hypothetical protein
MAKVQKPNTSEQVAEPATEEIIPVLELVEITLNEQGQLERRTSYIRQIADQPGEAQATVADVVARLPPGRPPEYDYVRIEKVVGDLVRETGIDDHFKPFAIRAWGECEQLRVEMPKASKPTTQFKKFCRQIYRRLKDAGK